MRSLFFSFAAAIVLLLSGPFASAQQSIVETVATGCESELKTYCDGVTPGEGRILSCLEATSSPGSARPLPAAQFRIQKSALTSIVPR